MIWGLLAAAWLSGANAWAQADPLEQGAMSVRKLDDGLYYMEYKGDDGFAGLLENGGGRSAAELSAYVTRFLSKGFYPPKSGNPGPMDYGCSALTVRTPEGGVLMGRNFDFNSATGIVLHTVPEQGYETYTTFNTNFLGFGEGWLPEGFKNQYMALSVLFFALDGINEKGLAVADLMAGDNAQTNQESGKPALTTTSAICYLLKNAQRWTKPWICSGELTCTPTSAPPITTPSPMPPAETWWWSMWTTGWRSLNPLQSPITTCAKPNETSA